MCHSFFVLHLYCKSIIKRAGTIRRVLSPIVPAFSALIYITYKKGELQNTTPPFVLDLLFKEKIGLLYSYRERINGNTSTTLCNMQQQIVNIH